MNNIQSIALNLISSESNTTDKEFAGLFALLNLGDLWLEDKSTGHKTSLEINSWDLNSAERKVILFTEVLDSDEEENTLTCNDLISGEIKAEMFATFDDCVDEKFNFNNGEKMAWRSKPTH